MNNPQKIYACKLKNEKLRLKSQSGGAFTAIAMCILRKGGIVYGCGMSSENQAIYKRVDNIDDLEELKGSKYVQAKMGDIIKELKKDLDENKIVLFSGTPCYVSAVNIFMKNHKNIENLYTVDLICHGVPSPMVYRDYLELCEKNEQSKIHKFFFREKISGGRMASTYGKNRVRKWYRSCD